MTARVLATVVVVAFVVGLVGIAYVVARRRSAAVVPGRPDALTDDVVAGLMTELRKTQAEAAYWKSAAERLQREAEQR